MIREELSYAVQGYAVQLLDWTVEKLVALNQWVAHPEVIGPKECPILHRWTVFGDRVQGEYDWRYKLLVHHFLPNADDRVPHDHPRPFVTLVLWGGYDDLNPCAVCNGTGARIGDYGAEADGWCDSCEGSGLITGDRMRPGMIRYRPAEHRHRTRVHARGCWTIVVMGPAKREWGFWVDGHFWPYEEFKAAFGDGMRCDDPDPVMRRAVAFSALSREAWQDYLRREGRLVERVRQHQERWEPIIREVLETAQRFGLQVTSEKRDTDIKYVTQWWRPALRAGTGMAPHELPVCPYCGARSAWMNDCSVCQKRLVPEPVSDHWIGQRR